MQPPAAVEKYIARDRQIKMLAEGRKKSEIRQAESIHLVVENVVFRKNQSRRSLRSDRKKAERQGDGRRHTADFEDGRPDYHRFARHYFLLITFYAIVRMRQFAGSKNGVFAINNIVGLGRLRACDAAAKFSFFAPHEHVFLN